MVRYRGLLIGFRKLLFLFSRRVKHVDEDVPIIHSHRGRNGLQQNNT